MDEKLTDEEVLSIENLCLKIDLLSARRDALAGKIFQAHGKSVDEFSIDLDKKALVKKPKKE